MLIGEQQFKDAFRNVVRGAFVVIVLSIFKSITEHLPGADTTFGHFRFSEYLNMLLTIAIVVVLLKIFGPLKAVLTFYLSTMMKVGKIPGREKTLDHVVAISHHIALLVYLIVLYEYLMPVVMDLNNAYLDFRRLKLYLDIGSVLFGIYILFTLWKDGQPVIEIITGGITDKVAGASAKVGYLQCPSCGSSNDLEAEFCVSCGKNLLQATSSTSTKCQKCGTANPDSAKFCQKCGHEIKK